MQTWKGYSMRHKITCVVLMLVCWTQIAYADSDNVAIETIILEAQGESLAGQIAVGEVMRNRANNRHQSIYTVCLSPMQFSCWNSASEARKRLKRVSGEVYQMASRAWAESESSNLTDGATYYIAKKQLKYIPAWVNTLKLTTVIENHHF